MFGRAIFVHSAASHPRIFNPVIANPTASYEVRNAVGSAYRYLCAAVPSASFSHKGDGWTRVTVPVRDEPALVAHLREFYALTCKKV